MDTAIDPELSEGAHALTGTLITSALAYSRLEREAKKRPMTADRLLARLLEIMGADDMYAAVLDDQP